MITEAKQENTSMTTESKQAQSSAASEFTDAQIDDLARLAMIFGPKTELERLPPYARAPSFVYFCQRPDGMIKIGLSGTPRRRVKSIRSQSGTDVILLACMPGKKEDEEALHRRFADQRSIGEWFRPSPELQDVICAAKEHGEPASQELAEAVRHKKESAVWSAAYDKRRAMLPHPEERFAQARAEIVRQIEARRT